MKERSLYLDVVKGLAIILVVVGHCIQFGSGVGVLATAYAAYAVLKRYSLTRLLFLGGR